MSATILVVLVMGLLGLVVGSFLAAVSIRLPRDEDVVLARSHCMSCQKTLSVRHLVPVFSWILLKGRCGWCRAKISPRYILIELAAAAVGVWAAISGLSQTDPSWLTVVVPAVLGWQLLLVGLIDAEHYWLPDILTWPLVLSGLAAAALMTQAIPWFHLIGAITGFVLLWSVAALYRRVRGREGLGGGDPFLMAGAGAWVGWAGLPSVLLWACAGGLSLVLARLVLRRPVSGADRLPFGTFLAMGIWLVWLWGPIGR